jgi:hypothetical protein
MKKKCFREKGKFCAKYLSSRKIRENSTYLLEKHFAGFFRLFSNMKFTRSEHLYSIPIFRQGSRIAPIEVKVSLRPPKPKTPPPKLVITPVGSAAAAKGSVSLMKSVQGVTRGLTLVPAKPADSSKVVKITANREGYISSSSG